MKKLYSSLFTYCFSLFVFIFFAFQSTLFADRDNLTEILKKYESENRKDSVMTNLLKKLYSKNKYSNPSLAIKYIIEAQQIFKESNNEVEMAQSYNLLGNIYFNLKMYYLAMDNYFKCYKIEENLDIKGAIGYALNDIANTYYAQKIYDVPFVYYKKAVVIFKNCGDRHGLGVSYNNIGLVKRNLLQYDSAMFYFNKALEIRKTLNDPFLIAHSYNYIGEIYYLKKDYDNALKYYNESLEIFNKNKKPRYVEYTDAHAETYYKIGNVYFTLKQYDNALKNYSEAISIYKSVSDNLMYINCLFEISKIYSDVGKYDISEEYLNNALTLINNNKFSQEKKECYNLLYLVNEKKGNIKSTLSYLKICLYLTDSLANRNLENKLDEVRVAIETLNEEKKYELLKEKDSYLKQLSFSIIFFLSMLVLLAFYIIYLRRKAEKRWLQLSNATFEAIVIHDNSIIIDANNKAEEIYGCKRKDFIRKSFFNFIPDSEKQKIWEKISQDQIAAYDTKILRPDGTVIPVEILSRPFVYKRRPVRVAALRDISSQIETEIKLEEDAAKLKELNATKDKFFSIIAHDLKNPFSSIIGFAEIILNDLYSQHTPKNQQLITYVQFIYESAKKAYELLENLHLWSRSQTGKLEFLTQKFDINTLIKYELTFFRKAVEQKQITLSYEDNPGIFVMADEILIKSVLRNLISNAIKYSDYNGTVSININSPLANTKLFSQNINMHTISVTDTGIGLEKDDIDKLFRLDVNNLTIGKTTDKGTGLGLILCKEFVEKNGGNIWVVSKPGHGSTFSFSLPKA